MHTPSAGPTYLCIVIRTTRELQNQKTNFKKQKHYELQSHRTQRPAQPGSTGQVLRFHRQPLQIGIEEIATRISGTCTVTRHDCLAVLSALQEQIIYALQEGKRVHLGDIGSFRTVANGLGSDTAEKYDPAYITKLRVCFTPNTKLKKAMSLDNKAFTLERVDFLPEEEDSEEEGDI